MLVPVICQALYWNPRFGIAQGTTAISGFSTTQSLMFVAEVEFPEMTNLVYCFVQFAQILGL